MKAVACVLSCLVALGTTRPVVALDAQYPSVSLTAVSGYQGHAFVYAQVTTEWSRVPAPSGSSFTSPYYARWTPLAIYATDCPWLWAVYVYDKATNTQQNPAPPNTPESEFGTSTLFCPSPAATPIGTTTPAMAQARLDLDLQVSVSPSRPAAGSPASLHAVLMSALQDDLSLFLSMAIRDWSVSRWDVGFGDGQVLQVGGGFTRGLLLTHTYTSPGSYDPWVVATVEGHAQAAVFDGDGRPRLIDRRFTVQVGNTALAEAGPPLTRLYLPPSAVAAVAPTLADDSSGPGTNTFRHIDAPRGAPVDLWLRPTLREGALLIDGHNAGHSVSSLMGWRYLGPAWNWARPGTPPGATLGSADPLRLQWNAPDEVGVGGPRDYVVPVLLLIRSRYPDGHIVRFAVISTITVSVDYVAEAG